MAGEFPEPTHEQWQEQVDKILRKTGLLGADEPAPEPVENVLASRTYDGITVSPLYTETGSDSGYPGLAPFVRGSRAAGSVPGGWDVRQFHEHPDAAEANKQILADLAGGATSLWLRLGRSGLAIEDLPDALEGVHLDLIAVELDAGPDFAAAATAVLDLAQEQGVRLGGGNLGADPLGVQARTGQAPDRAGSVELALRCAREHRDLHALTVDGLPYHEAGGSDAEELGTSLAAATTYLRWLTEAGLDVDTAVSLLEFRYAATADQFLTIAKLRAARRLWERVTRECGASEPASAQAQHAVTSPAMLTQRDPWVNMLRATIATFAAGVGGAQALTVLPFDAAVGLPDSFSRRIARNTQALLLEESHLAKVIDPAGGSWYVETLTDELAHASWEWFQRIEAEGGLPAALDSGLVADRLAATWQQRSEALARRQDPITGVSEFPLLDEEPLSRTPAPDPESGGLPRVRYAEAFEELRDTADAQLAETGSRPRVFLATLGPIAAHNARAAFAGNLLAAGGIEAPEAGVVESTQDVVDRFAESGTSVACLCSSDRIYAEQAAETARVLKQAGASHILLAGEPTDPPPDDVDGFVFAGCNALETLRDLHRRLGAEQ